MADLHPYQTIRLERIGAVARITLNRPEALNAINEQMTIDLDAALTELEGDDEIRVLIVTGAGRAFSAGRDAKEIGSATHRSAAALWDRFEGYGKPVIGQVNGLCYTGALSMLLTFDVVIASEGATFSDTHAKFGMNHGGGTTQRLRNAVGPRKAKEMIFSCLPVSAVEAERIGLINRVASADGLEAETMALAQAMATNDPDAIRVAKSLINHGMTWGTASGMERERAAYVAQRRRVADGSATIEVGVDADGRDAR